MKKKYFLWKYDLCFANKISETFCKMICWVSADQRSKNVREKYIDPFFKNHS